MSLAGLIAVVTSRGFPSLSPDIESFCVCIQARARPGGRARAAVATDTAARALSHMTKGCCSLNGTLVAAVALGVMMGVCSRCWSL